MGVGSGAPGIFLRTDLSELGERYIFSSERRLPYVGQTSSVTRGFRLWSLSLERFVLSTWGLDSLLWLGWLWCRYYSVQ